MLQTPSAPASRPSSLPDWQPTLEGPRLRARPLVPEDFDALFAAASDPAIWALHPVPDRWTKPKFEIYFRTGITSGGALVVEDIATGTIVGSSRFTAFDPERKSVEIGYTFLARSLWGSGFNRELKMLMLAHAFHWVDTAVFVVGVNNARSRAAMEKIGGRLVGTISELEPEGDLRVSVVFEMTKSSFTRSLEG